MKKSINKESNEGFALAAVLVAGMVLGLIGVSVIHQATLQGVQGVYKKIDKQLFWQAQSGLEQAAGCFMQGDLSASNISGDNLSVVIYALGNNQFEVYSTATNGSRNATLKQLFDITLTEFDDKDPTTGPWDLPLLCIMPDEHGYRIMPPNNMFKSPFIAGIGQKNNGGFFNNASNPETIGVYGNIYAFKNTSINGNIELSATGINEGFPKETNEEMDEFNPDALAPVYAKMKQYQEQIIAGGEVVYMEPNLNMNLNGEVKLLRGSWSRADVNASGGVNITGTGTVMVNGDLDVGNSFHVSPNITLLVNGNVTGSSINLNGANNILYVAGDINIDNTNAAGVILVGGKMVAKNNATIHAFVFVEKYLMVKNNCQFNGVLASTQLLMKNNQGFFLRRDYLPSWLTDNSTTDDVKDVVNHNDHPVVESITRHSWEKI